MSDLRRNPEGGLRVREGVARGEDAGLEGSREGRVADVEWEVTWQEVPSGTWRVLCNDTLRAAGGR